MIYNRNKGENNMLLMITALVVVGLIYIYRNGISGNDFWWHVKVGEWITNNKVVPKSDIFSWYGKEVGLKWISHEWLADVFFYKIFHFFGDVGIFILSLSTSISMALLIIIRNKEEIKNNVLVGLLYIVPSIGIFPAFFYGRPQLISYCLLFIVLHLLYSFRYTKHQWLIFILPFISIIWANVHGGSSNLVYILCMIFFVCGTLNISVGRIVVDRYTKKQAKILLVVAILCFFALFINPHGIEVVKYPYIGMAENIGQNTISEWASPDAKSLAQLVFFFLPVVIISLSFVISKSNIKLIDITLFLFFAFLFFRSTRFIVLLYISSSFFIFNYQDQHKVKVIDNRIGVALYRLFYIILGSAVIYSIIMMSNTWDSKGLISKVVGPDLLETIKIEAPKRLYNDYNFGEALIFGGIDTFVDARADLFSPTILSDAIGLLFQTDPNRVISSGVYNPDQVIEKYKFDAFVIQPNRQLAVYLSNSDDYKLIYEDDKSVFFIRITVY